MTSYAARYLLLAFVVFLGTLVSGELYQYFREPVAPDEVSIPPIPDEPTRFDPASAPRTMFDECRREGKVLHATRADGRDWIYECVRP